MKKNTAILNTVTKMINFNFNGEEFEIDLKEGDLHDSLNSITTKNDVVFDINFSWEDSKFQPDPAFSVYSLIDNENGSWSTDWEDGTTIKIVEIIGDKNQYFRDTPQEYNPNAIPHKFEVFNGQNELQFKTKKFNKACDECGIQKLQGNLGWYFMVIDAEGGRKKIN